MPSEIILVPCGSPSWATVLTLLIGIIAVLSGVLITLAWHYSREDAQELSHQLMDRLSRHVVDRTAGYLPPSMSST